MRGRVHNNFVRVRVSDALLAAASSHAGREGMSLSELVRHAVRREVGRVR